MSKITIDQYQQWLSDDGVIAIIIKQALRPDDAEDRVIFPPTYPMTNFVGRVHTIRDGDYRVSVELPSNVKNDKDEKKENQKAGYNIDFFTDGTNCCEIDSPQSQGNRIEPKFKTIFGGKLVPQIEIQVGDDPLHSKKVNLLDAGHRAADAVVRMSSLADKFHAAFRHAKRDDHFMLATLAPTSLLLGVWDSRSTYVKIQRILKAYIRATNVYPRSRSAQFTPAADYVAAGALDEGLDSGEGEKNPLSAEGMKHALATQTVGGVALTDKSTLTRTIKINLVALRQLRAKDAAHTKALQQYIFGLALVAATCDPDLNLREGCNLKCEAREAVKLVRMREDDEPVTLDVNIVMKFVEDAARTFFNLANIDFDKKDYKEAKFETGVAEQFLGMTADERKKISQLGPITAATIKKFAEQGKDPFKVVADAVKTTKDAIGKAPGKKDPRTKNLDAFKPLAEALTSMSENVSLDDDAKQLAGMLAAMTLEHEDSHVTLKEIESKIKEFKKSRKANAAAGGSPTEHEAQS